MDGAIIFVCSMVGAVIIAVYILTFSASALLVVVEGTAGGNDEVSWPSEPWADILGRAAYLGTLIGLWLIPAGFLWNGLKTTLLPDQPALRLLLIALPGLWLYFPIGLFSSLTSQSGWAFLRLHTVRDLIRIGPATFYFYLASAGLALLVGFVWTLTLTSNPGYLIVAAPLTSYAWLVYARLLGRLALKIGLLKPMGKKKPKKDAVRRPLRKDGPVVPRPEAVGDPQPVKQPRPAWIDPEPEPYSLGDEEPPAREASIPLDGYDPINAEELAPAAPGGDRIDNANQAVIDRDRRVLRKKKPAKLPDRPMFEGILSFPFYPQCIGPMVNVAFGWALLGVLLVMMLDHNVVRS